MIVSEDGHHRDIDGECWNGCPACRDAVDIDLRGKSGDVRYECPVAGCWGVTLTPDGEDEWTKNRTIRPRCTKHDVELVRKVFE